MKLETYSLEDQGALDLRLNSDEVNNNTNGGNLNRSQSSSTAQGKLPAQLSHLPPACLSHLYPLAATTTGFVPLNQAQPFFTAVLLPSGAAPLGSSTPSNAEVLSAMVPMAPYLQRPVACYPLPNFPQTDLSSASWPSQLGGADSPSSSSSSSAAPRQLQKTLLSKRHSLNERSVKTPDRLQNSTSRVIIHQTADAEDHFSQVQRNMKLDALTLSSCHVTDAAVEHHFEKSLARFHLSCPTTTAGAFSSPVHTTCNPLASNSAGTSPTSSSSLMMPWSSSCSSSGGQHPSSEDLETTVSPTGSENGVLAELMRNCPLKPKRFWMQQYGLADCDTYKAMDDIFCSKESLDLPLRKRATSETVEVCQLKRPRSSASDEERPEVGASQVLFRPTF